MVSALAFYSDDLSSNPAELYNFYSVNCLKRTKRNGDGPFLKMPPKLNYIYLQKMDFADVTKTHQYQDATYG